MTTPKVPARGAAGSVNTRASRGIWVDSFQRLLRNKLALVGGFLIAIFLVAAAIAPLLVPNGALAGVLADRLQLPSPEHLMGTDALGRDEFSRIVVGSRVSLLAAVASVGIGVTIGGTIGAIAGGLGGKVDSVLMRVVDVMLSIPGLLLAIGIVAWLGRGLLQIMFAVAMTNAPIFARLLRGSLLSLREADFVIAARTIGASRTRLILRHLIPNAMTPLIVQVTLALGTAIIDVAGLGYLGLGPPDPRTPDWGTMLVDSTEFLRQAPYLIFFPGLALVLSVVGFNLLGDGLREALDPRMRRLR
jgi:peptide/nickel transport system permease protein